MTEQKAIETIKYASAFNSDNSPLTKALDIAIKALEKTQEAAGATDEKETIENFLEFVDKNSRAIDEDYDKTYTIDDLSEYVEHFVKASSKTKKENIDT